MINIKGGTKTWSDAVQRSDMKSDGMSSMSAVDAEKHFGNEDIGNVLNQITDPNWVDPAKKVRQVGSQDLDKDAFLNLLLTQMKNQDPTNPLKSHEMAAQLAQFTSLEKLTNIDQGIENLAKAQTPNHNFEALPLIGKTVTADGSKISRSDMKSGHDIRFHLGADAVKAKLKILDAEGKEIRTLTVNGLKSGKNEIFWNGQLEDGTPAKVGDYTVEVEAEGSNGNKIFAETKFEGKISGVQFTAKGPVLMVGDTQMALSDINKIVDEDINQAQMQSRAANANRAKESGVGNSPLSMGPSTPGAVPQMMTPAPATVAPAANKTLAAGPKSNVPAAGSELENVAMSRGMMNTLKKSGITAGI